jgi:hypothetical protein
MSTEKSEVEKEYFLKHLNCSSFIFDPSKHTLGTLFRNCVNKYASLPCVGQRQNFYRLRNKVDLLIFFFYLLKGTFPVGKLW